MNADEKAQIQCFGMTLEEFKKSNSTLTDWNDPTSLMALSMSIQSDCQEFLECVRDSNEQVRKWLNLSKYVLGEASRVARLRESMMKMVMQERSKALKNIISSCENELRFTISS